MFVLALHHPPPPHHHHHRHRHHTHSIYHCSLSLSSFLSLLLFALLVLAQLSKTTAIVMLQNHWRIRNSKFLFLILTAKRKLENIAASKIQRIALGFGGRRRAKLRKKIKVMEEREFLLGDRSYVMAQGFRREGAVVMIQRWLRHMQGGWMRPKFLGHILITRPQALWRGHIERTGSHLKELRLQRWLKVVLEDSEQYGPPVMILQCWWRGRHRRRLFQLMLKASADHIAALRQKKQEAFEHEIIAAPGILGKMGVKIDRTKMKQRSRSFRRSMSFGWRGKRKHCAVQIQTWWRGILVSYVYGGDGGGCCMLTYHCSLASPQQTYSHLFSLFPTLSLSLIFQF